MELSLSLETGFNLNLKEGGSGPALWTPARLSTPPQLMLDADRLDLLTKDGSNVLTSIRTVYGNTLGNTPALVTHTTAASAFNNHGSFNAPGQASQQLNFSTNLGGLLNNKAGCTMMIFGRFSNPAPSAFNSAVVNATTSSSSSTRCSIATSGSVANALRTTVRRLDADTANGDDIDVSNRGTTPFIAILRLDNNGVQIGAGTPTKEIQICSGGLSTVVSSEATGLGIGNFSATNSAYIGFFNSGTVAQSLTDMTIGFITDQVLSTADVQRVQGWAAWSRQMSSMLASDHPYKLAPP